jgi:hypothetical protein
MAKKFENLEAACGGAINPETLEKFQAAMKEYTEFMYGLNALFAPAPTQTLQ